MTATYPVLLLRSAAVETRFWLSHPGFGVAAQALLVDCFKHIETGRPIKLDGPA